ncbi:MAG: hypothetical protein A4E66_02242 [Syntrophus sp. PtaB.Bin001]|jgi:hypothetical protein|nr:MAG: hypothetical protein A4E66_02242 [Syntrophus sp. PtaB.Bin001]
MKKIVGGLFAVISILVFLLAADSYAQRGMMWRGSGGWGTGSEYGRLYNPNTVTTITGEVVKVDSIAPIRGMSYGVHLVVKTATETISVHLGPAWYIENQDIKIEPKDKITVKGSRITFQDKPAIIAAQVKKGDQTLELRDANGFPAWSGWRRR